MVNVEVATMLSGGAETDRRSVDPDEFLTPVTGPVRQPYSGPGFVSPLLVMLAAISILEGYRWLDVIRATPWLPSAPVFVALAIPTASALTRPRGGERRGLVQNAVMAASVALVAATGLMLFVHGPSVTHLLGTSDLLVAISALGAAAAAQCQRQMLGENIDAGER
jgi:hypothetical protein